MPRIPNWVIWLFYPHFQNAYLEIHLFTRQLHCVHTEQQPRIVELGSFYTFQLSVLRGLAIQNVGK